MGLAAAVAVLLHEALRLADLLEGMPFQIETVGLGEGVGAGDEDQGPIPEVLLLVVGGEA